MLKRNHFIKRVWFWVLVVILIIIIGSSLNNKGVTKEADNGGKKNFFVKQHLRHLKKELIKSSFIKSEIQ